MIHINLLPQEYRQANRIPIRFTVGVCVAVAINCSLIAWWAGMAFGVKAEVNSELAVLEDTKSSIDPQVTYHKSLEQENAIYKSREATLREITGNRMSWTKKVDEMIDVVNRGGYGEKYLIWFDDLSVAQMITPGRGSFGSLSASGHSGNPNFAHVANFLEDLEGSPFIADFGALSPPQGSQSSIDKDLLPAENWSFPLELNLLSPDERAAAAALRAALTEEVDSNE
ncbi:MAG: hypothetical protein ACI8TQ_000686 [Planctomycetota bacterium]|jgi:hypothetical protein